MAFSRVWYWFRIAATVWLAGLVLVTAARTMHWKVVSDPAQVFFSCTLVDSGLAPYREIMDNQMPGTYLFYSGVMHTLGTGDLTWRVFDLALLFVAALAMLIITRPAGWFAGAWAAGMFALLHMHGGEEQMGQRDLVIAILLLAMYACVFTAVRQRIVWPLLIAGFCGSLAGTIKPTALLFTLALVVVTGVWMGRSGLRAGRGVTAFLAGVAVPLLVVFWYLWSKGSLPAFAHLLTAILPFYAHMGRIGIPAMLMTSKTIPLIGLFIALGLAVALLNRDWQWESSLLALGVAFGVAHYFVQGRGFPYHRYPLAAFLFAWIAVVFVKALQPAAPVGARWLAGTGLLLGLVVAPELAHHAIHDPEWAPEYRELLTRDLQALGGARLSGHIQCLAAAGDCDGVLLRMHLAQATGLMYDFLVLGDGSHPVIQEFRARTWAQMERNPPEVIVLSPYLFPQLPCTGKPLAGAGMAGAEAGPMAYDGEKYAKLKTWPALDQLLAERYSLMRDQVIPVEHTHCPFSWGYRVYQRRS